MPPLRPPLYDDQCYNALVHHGGHNGLIRWGIAVHGFIDEHTRFISGVRAHTSNCPQVVLGFFEEVVRTQGLPRRVRGSCNSENALIAAFMQEARGTGRGSYLWTSANDNIQNRIGRLWANFTTHLGGKWKEFFNDLECGWGLDPEIPGHIWLLRYLFLDIINQEIALWTSAWNHRKLSIPGEGSQSPINRRFTSILQHGGNPLAPHLFEPVQDPVELYDGGVREGDWVDDYPDSLKGAAVDEVDCPFTIGEFHKFNRRLQSIPVTIRSSNIMEQRGQLWVDAFVLCQEIVEESAVAL